MTTRFSLLASPRRKLLATLAAAGVAVSIGAFAAGPALAASTLPTINATVNSTSITVSGALQSGAVNVVSTATGGKEPAVVLIKLNPGVTAAETFAFLDTNKASQDPNTVSKFGSIVFDAEAGKQPTEAQTILAAGQYIAVNAEGEKSSKWARSSFAVAESKTPAVLPAAQATEKTIEFGFKGSVGAESGRGRAL